MTSKKIVAGILTGVAAAAVVSLILASRKDCAFSKNLVQKGANLADDLKGKFSEFIDRMEDKLRSSLK